VGKTKAHKIDFVVHFRTKIWTMANENVPSKFYLFAQFLLFFAISGMEQKMGQRMDWNCVHWKYQFSRIFT